jgi:ribonucleoside-diphosphate reductase alpha chain
MTEQYGPTLPISEEIHSMKYRGEGESFSEGQARVAHTLADSTEHFNPLYRILLRQGFLPAGRVQAAIGSLRFVTAMNCFVSGTIEDSFDNIMKRATEAGQTMRLGGGIGYDFSTLRPRGDNIVSLDSRSSGPISFMAIYDAICHTISSAGHRRGAQMGVLRVDHPDIEEFIRAKQNEDKLRAFNVSVGITDEFMEAVKADKNFDLVFDGRVYKTVRAKNLWEEIMRSTWEWAEPGVLFIDRINEMNNLHYCEIIAATNPCGEQPLPPYGACLLGSFNLVKYITDKGFDFDKLKQDIPHVVRAMDNIHDVTEFPLEEQRLESQNKRRMGLGVTAVANTGEILGHEYGSESFNKWLESVLEFIRNEVYNASIDLAKEKGAFPLFDADKYLEGKFIKTLPQGIRRRIRKYGIRNSHLLSIAPTGTISLSADNVSSGIEPVFSHYYDRTIQTFDGPIVERVEDYAYRVHGVKGKTANECTAQEHLGVLAIAQKYVDSACSKTINIDPDTDWNDFKQIYMTAYETGCKGCTTFNPEGKRFGILNVVKEDKEGAEACYIDPSTGKKSCE